MRVNPGYRSNLRKADLAFLDATSPTRRAQIEEVLKYSNNEALDDLLHHYDGDLNDPAIRILLDPAMKDAMIANVAGAGYRAQDATPGTRGEGRGKYLLKPDEPIDYQGEEQRALEILALRKELEYIQGGKTVPIDQSNPLYQSIARHTSADIRPASIIQTGNGGIDNVRAKHPNLPAQTLKNATIATNNQLFDNLVGNERGEQPITNVDRHGNRSGIPVEHKLSFKGNEELGRDPDNRMLGSTVKNSVLRAEPDPRRQEILLMSNLAQAETDYSNKFGRDVRDMMVDNNWIYKPGVREMPDYGTARTERRFASKPAVAEAARQTYGGSTRSESPGTNRERALIIEAGGDVNIGEGVLRSNGKNGNGNGNGKH